MFTICLRFGLLPDSFYTGLLIPVLKKKHLDPCIARNYRPITVSVALSKLFECCILEECSNHDFDPSQFGFVTHRGTNMAISLAHDVNTFCLARGSTTYMCSLDAEGAFDAIPHSVLFAKAIDIIPDHYWKTMLQWYQNMSVKIKWNGGLSDPISIERGTRQGGLTSPFLFNIFYQDLVELISDKKCGITLEGNQYNIFCYADDVLLCSTTPTGLQHLIDCAVEHIARQGLIFNPSKTICMVFGKNNFTSEPSWNIQDTRLAVEDHIPYLGANLAHDNGLMHTNQRISAAHRAFYMLQNTGLYYKGVNPETATQIFSMGVRTVLTYGCEAIHLNKSKLAEMEKTQGKFVKLILGLRNSSHTTPLLQSLHINSIKSTMGLASLNLLRSCLIYKSKATDFYSYLLQCDTAHIKTTLIGRVNNFSLTNNINVFSYVLNNDYRRCIHKRLKSDICDGSDGLIDTARFLLSNDYVDHSRDLLQLLVSSF